VPLQRIGHFGKPKSVPQLRGSPWQGLFREKGCCKKRLLRRQRKIITCVNALNCRILNSAAQIIPRVLLTWLCDSEMKELAKGDKYVASSRLNMATGETIQHSKDGVMLSNNSCFEPFGSKRQHWFEYCSSILGVDLPCTRCGTAYVSQCNRFNDGVLRTRTPKKSIDHTPFHSPRFSAEREGLKFTDKAVHLDAKDPFWLPRLCVSTKPNARPIFCWKKVPATPPLSLPTTTHS